MNNNVNVFPENSTPVPKGVIISNHIQTKIFFAFGSSLPYELKLSDWVECEVCSFSDHKDSYVNERAKHSSNICYFRRLDTKEVTCCIANNSKGDDPNPRLRLKK